MISVCMIVKDEAQHLENSLHALAQYFDDIVVVDTGSTDCSKEIAARFTNKIYDFQWIADFSAARNFSLSFAKYDWVLIVDADEVLSFIDLPALSTLIDAHPTGIGRVERVDYIDDPNGGGIIRERIGRLFRKTLYEYRGIIHEQVNARNAATPVNRFYVPISLNHVGYQTEILLNKDKIVRNITLLRTAIDGNPTDPYLHYQLGKSYYLAKDYLSASESFSTALGYQTDFSYEYNEQLIEGYGYALINLGEYKQALTVLEYEKYCHSTDFSFLKALILMNNGDLQQAINIFLSCTQMPPGRSEGVNNYKANYNIGVILECSGMLKDAMAFYQKCDNFKPALDGITRIGKQG
ncbi:glycosyltransferase [Brenneria rubrifaciens]|uniref:Glycosyltransferase n=1 Tax=Brenneria rubrifaciens TaxID=55213 RepID=A0A4P8R3R2_9GAMM|nr:glycosyltransferase family 2 protein [Brenneria rubrifaciens]QCR10304.1 glycosyltransferase [Brenneria rubrifaciens]